MKPVDAGGHKHRHEKTDIDIRKVLLSAAGLAAFLIATIVAAVVLYNLLAARDRQLNAQRSGTVASELRPPEPRLQPDPLRDLRTYRAQQAEPLSSYGWIDRASGRIRIPVEQAMAILAERKLPVRTRPEAAPAVSAPAAEAPKPAEAAL